MPDWIARQQDKIDRGLAAMSSDLGERQWCNGEGYSLADIAVGCCLGYLDFRFPAINWREPYPNLANLLERLSARPSFIDTRPPAAEHANKKTGHGPVFLLQPPLMPAWVPT
jgi:glutathione S-transferase